MNKTVKTLTVAAALAGAASLAMLSQTGDARADQVRCYGIAQAGQNDCEHASGSHSCNGHATEDYDGGDWKYVSSSEECAARNGKLEPFEGRNPDIQS
jgi:uncharacterized membrane protein